MRFIADSMLGRLAKSLRMLGFDVAYDPFIADQRLLAQARREQRIILTRDTQMLRRRGLPRLVFIASDHLRDQLAQVARELGVQLDRSALFTRCIVCNGELDAAPKESVRAEVPPYVYQTQGTFARCRGCGRTYWRGTHVEDMERRLEDLAAG
jgi:uncharacterized protein with PIN domain